MMSKDDDAPITLDETMFESLEHLDDLAEVDYELELLRTMEMSKPSVDTRPIQPVFEAKTSPMDVPEELLQHARPTSEGPAASREIRFNAWMAEDGVLRVPPQWRALLAHREVEIVINLKE